MPNLPRFYSTRGAPERSALAPINPSMVGQEAEAVEKSGLRLQDLGYRGWELSQKIEEAAEVEKILNTHYKLKDDFRAMAERFRERRDYDKFDEDADREMEGIRQKYEGSLTSDNMRKGFDRSFLAQSSILKDALLHKKAQVVTENALGAFSRTYDEAVSDYISTDDENIKKAIEINLEVESGMLVNRNIMKPQDQEKLLSSFNAQADEAQVRKIGLTDPLKAYGMLMSKEAFPYLDPIRRVQLTEHMEVRARMEEGRQDKLNTAIQRENQVNAIDDYAAGKLDVEGLIRYRARDKETGMPGLSDAFFVPMLEKLKHGKDVTTDPKTFADLYLKEDITRLDIDRNSDKLSVHDQRILLNRILQEGREDERDARSLRRERMAEERRRVSEEKREISAQERAEKDRRNHYTSDARSYMKKAFNELSIEAEEGGKMLRTFQGYVDDPKIPPEELVEYAQKVLEGRKGGVARQLWNWMFPDKAKSEMREKISPPPKTQEGEFQPMTKKEPGVAKPRKPLDEIFGGRTPNK